MLQALPNISQRQICSKRNISINQHNQIKKIGFAISSELPPTDRPKKSPLLPFILVSFIGGLGLVALTDEEINTTTTIIKAFEEHGVHLKNSYRKPIFNKEETCTGIQFLNKDKKPVTVTVEDPITLKIQGPNNTTLITNLDLNTLAQKTPNLDPECLTYNK